MLEWLDTQIAILAHKIRNPCFGSHHPSHELNLLLLFFIFYYAPWSFGKSIKHKNRGKNYIDFYILPTIATSFLLEGFHS